MGLATFIGGIHPYEGKELSEDKPIKVLEPLQGEIMVYPLSQHIGAPAKPLVAKGDHVLKGQIIAEAGGFISANVLSSVSGTVKGIESKLVANGAMVQSILVENDGEEEAIEGFGTDRDATKLSKEEIRKIVKDAGIVGLGGAGFPTHVKLTPKDENAIDYVIVNGAECEPYLNGDHLTMKNHPEELLKGIELARIASGLDKAYYGIEKNKQDAIDLLLSKNPAQYGVEIVPENVKYPQGAEKMQIKAITNREVKPGGLPSGVGCNVISTQTAYAIYRACYEGMPSIERVLTVAGSAMGDKSYNLQCRFGTPFSYIVEQCGGFVVEPKKIVLGGPMMGLIATNLEAPNIKGTAGILFFTEKEDRSVENPTCIHCGKCLTVCPMKLEPLYMYKYYQKRDFENMQKYHILDCFECGSCSYNCPGRLPLTHTFKTAKLLFAARAAEEKARAEAAAKEAETK